MCKHHFGVQLLQNPPLCSSTVSRPKWAWPETGEPADRQCGSSPRGEARQPRRGGPRQGGGAVRPRPPAARQASPRRRTAEASGPAALPAGSDFRWSSFLVVRNSGWCFLSWFGIYQGVTKRCRLSLLANSALVYKSKCGGIVGVAGSQPINTAVHITWHGARLNFGDLPPYLTYGIYLYSSVFGVYPWIQSLLAMHRIFSQIACTLSPSIYLGLYFMKHISWTTEGNLFWISLVQSKDDKRHWRSTKKDHHRWQLFL